MKRTHEVNVIIIKCFACGMAMWVWLSWLASHGIVRPLVLVASWMIPLLFVIDKDD